MTDSTQEELLAAVKESLLKDGRLNKFKGEIRAAVMSVLDKTGNQKPKDIPDETKLLNDLIKEYLEFNGYRYSEQVLVAESGQSENTQREVMISKLNITDESRTAKIPLLYLILAEFQKRKQSNT